jgi:hypothetical protein
MLMVRYHINNVICVESLSRKGGSNNDFIVTLECHYHTNNARTHMPQKTSHT